MRLLDAQPGHYYAILRLNEAAVPHVNSIPLAKLQALSEQRFAFLVAEAEEGDGGPPGAVAGFVLALDESADYDSLNFAYFRERFATFAYIDRVVIAPEFRRRGVSSLLYRELIARCGNTKPVLTCEVNLEPPNPESLAFHEARGFQRLATQQTEQGAKTVQLMAKPLLSIG